MNYAKVLLDLYRLKRNEKKSSARMNAVQDKKLLIGRFQILYIAVMDGRYGRVMTVDEIMPDRNTGKKPLILAGEVAV